MFGKNVFLRILDCDLVFLLEVRWIPIPPCFLAEDEDGTRVVVDGQQRLIAIDDFYHGRYALTGLEVLAGLNGLKWADLPSKYDRKIL